MAETIAVTLGMIFVGTIVICLTWTILSYIVNEATSANKRLEENIKQLDKNKKA